MEVLECNGNGFQKRWYGHGPTFFVVGKKGMELALYSITHGSVFEIVWDNNWGNQLDVFFVYTILKIICHKWC